MQSDATSPEENVVASPEAPASSNACFAGVDPPPENSGAHAAPTKIVSTLTNARARPPPPPSMPIPLLRRLQIALHAARAVGRRRHAVRPSRTGIPRTRAGALRIR